MKILLMDISYLFFAKLQILIGFPNETVLFFLEKKITGSLLIAKKKVDTSETDVNKAK
jgi:hypothetical protein